MFVSSSSSSSRSGSLLLVLLLALVSFTTTIASVSARSIIRTHDVNAANQWDAVNQWDAAVSKLNPAEYDVVVSATYAPDTGAWKCVIGSIDQNAVALGFYMTTLNSTGWDQLRVFTNGAFDDRTQMFGAGFAEGCASDRATFDIYTNLQRYYFGTGAAPPGLAKFIEAQDAWMLEQIGKYANSSKVWRGMDLINQQLTGLVAGYNAGVFGSTQPFARYQMLLLNAMGDIDDILTVVSDKFRPQWDKWGRDRIVTEINRRSRCSALVRVNGDMTTLLGAHSTWFTFSSMNRVYKYYYFELHGADVATRRMSFSSYPSFLESMDDFYVMDSGLVMLETTNSIFNMSLYDLVVPQALLAWHRVRLANMYAHTGGEWVELVREYNSGTYNNQYMLIDYKLFTPGQPLLPDTLWVCEQIPGLIVGADMTRELERGYWSSYNIPYFLEIYNRSGYPAMVTKLGVGQSYQLAPRANIFRRDVGNVVNITTLQDIMRYNDYLADPYSAQDPWSAICSRGDLAKGGSPDGCLDTKTTDNTLVASGSASVLSGPTVSHGLPPFSWTGQWADLPHQGMPTVWNFPFISVPGMWDASEEEVVAA